MLISCVQALLTASNPSPDDAVAAKKVVKKTKKHYSLNSDINISQFYLVKTWGCYQANEEWLEVLELEWAFLASAQPALSSSGVG